MSPSPQEIDTALETDTTTDENEVDQIIQSITEAQYFDANSMAPLTPTARVSLSFILTHSVLVS